MNYILKVHNLSVELEGHPIIENLSFEVERGETIMVLGPNGAGKTTLFRALMGFVSYRGTIVWKEGCRVGFVPQGLDVNRKFPLTVRELFDLAKARATEAEVAEALDLVNAARLANRSLATLSSGEFQRVLVAFAFIQKPDVLLFDEPTSDIDVGGQETIYRRLERISKQRGLTLLMISHDLNVVFSYATQVICLNRELKCQGKPREILTPRVLQDLYGSQVDFYQHTHAIQKPASD